MRTRDHRLEPGRVERSGLLESAERRELLTGEGGAIDDAPVSRRRQCCSERLLIAPGDASDQRANPCRLFRCRQTIGDQSGEIFRPG